MTQLHHEQPHQQRTSLEQIVREELRWQAPPDLTASLLALAQQASTGTLPPLAPPIWYRLTVLLLTTLTVGVSVGIAWHFYTTLLITTGVLAWWNQIHATLNAAINAGWHTLYTTFPLSQQVIESLPTLQAYLSWVLAAIVLWLALDDRATPLAPQHQPAR